MFKEVINNVLEGGKTNDNYTWSALTGIPHYNAHTLNQLNLETFI